MKPTVWKFSHKVPEHKSHKMRYSVALLTGILGGLVSTVIGSYDGGYAPTHGKFTLKLSVSLFVQLLLIVCYFGIVPKVKVFGIFLV